MIAVCLNVLIFIYDPHISHSSGPAFLASSIIALYSSAFISAGSFKTAIASNLLEWAALLPL
jgi:hypothetical protein